MIAEGIVALIWAAAATYYFHYYEGGMGVSDASVIVFDITHDWLGAIGGVLAILGVVAAPVTTGDTALRSARLIVADMLHVDQGSLAKRLTVSAVIFAATIGILFYNLADADGFNVVSCGVISRGPTRLCRSSRCGLSPLFWPVAANAIS